jgi:hypothetical protein
VGLEIFRGIGREEGFKGLKGFKGFKGILGIVGDGWD